MGEARGGAGWCVVALVLGACAPPPVRSQSDGGAVGVTQDGATATVLLGTIDRGRGTAGLALLAILSDEEGAAWAGEVLNAESAVVASFVYGTPDGSQPLSAWWPALPAAWGSRYTVRFFEPGGRELRVTATLSPSSGLEVPQPELTPTGARLSWPEVPGAAAYECATAGSAPEHSTTPGCAVFPTMKVRALSVDLSKPLVVSELPRSFDVSETDYAYGVGTSGAKVRAALGSIQYATGASGFAALVSVQTPSGGPPTVPWNIEISGPAFGSTGSLRGTQLAATDRLILWAYDATPTEGLYQIRASSPSDTVTFSLRAPAMVIPMPEVMALTAVNRGAGGAVLAWQAIGGARGYFASAWARGSGALTASSWGRATGATFSPGTFVTGETYDVFVTASSADPTTGAALPSFISLSENTYRPVSFTSR